MVFFRAANRAALNAKARICRNRCPSLLTVQAVIPLHHPGVPAAAQAVPAVPAQAAVHAIKNQWSVEVFSTLRLSISEY
jgi:hypothetical protein